MKKFIIGMLSSDGKESFSRCACFFLIYCLSVWATYIVGKTAVIPDIPLQWAALITLVYLGGKGIDAVTTIKGAANVPASQNVPAQQ